MVKNIAVLGSTGSVGSQCLCVCKNLGCSVSVLTGYSQVEKLARQAREFLPHTVVIGDKSKYSQLKLALADLDINVLAGGQAICEAATLPQVDVVFNAIVGIAGLRPTLAAIQAGKALALSNKESLVAAGELVMAKLQEKSGIIMPVDSEHSAIWRCLAGSSSNDLRSVILTASGGPFVGKTRAQLTDVTPKQAVAHPNWCMGTKISLDCATMMNKGLEVIEAMWLFGLTLEQIQVVVHRQSIMHSAVEFWDGSVIAQLGVPNMHLPIQYALTYPNTLPIQNSKRLSLTDYASLSFEGADMETFVCLQVCMKAARLGGLSPCVANGANEQAAELFLAGKIGFLQIGELVSLAVDSIQPKISGSITLTDIENTNFAAREFVLQQKPEVRK